MTLEEKFKAIADERKQF